MSEVKRGSPTDDGEYICKVDSAVGDVLLKRTGNYYTAYTGAVFKPEQIIAHRKHEPLVVPELKGLHRCEGVDCVIRYGGGFTPMIACRYGDMLIVHHPNIGCPHQIVEGCNDIEYLTKEQCEAEGYRWPSYSPNAANAT